MTSPTTNALIKSLLRLELNSINELMTVIDAVRDEAMVNNDWQTFFKYSEYYYRAKELHQLSTTI